MLAEPILRVDLPVSDVAPVAPVGLRQLVSSGPLRLVLAFADAREYVQHVTALTRVPGSPDWLLGVFASSGYAVPLIDLAAWAHRIAPESWQASAGTTANSVGHLNALRFGDATHTWAIRTTRAPEVFDPQIAKPLAVSTQLPLQVSSDHGRLMQHAAEAWTLPAGGVALQIRWAEVYDHLLQELGSANLA